MNRFTSIIILIFLVSVASFGGSFPFKMNETFIYQIQVTYEMVEDSGIDREWYNEDEYAGEEDQKRYYDKFKTETVGNHNFKYYKTKPASPDSGSNINYHYFIFHFDYGGENPIVQTDGMYVTDDNGYPIFIKFEEKDSEKTYYLIYRGEFKEDMFNYSYSVDSNNKINSTKGKTDIKDKFIIDENLLFTLAIYLKLNNPYNKEQFTIPGFIPRTVVIPNLENTSLAEPSEYVEGFILSKKPVFRKEYKIPLEKLTAFYIIPENQDLKFISKGEHKIRVNDKKVVTRKFIDENNSLEIYIDKKGNLIKTKTSIGSYVQVENKVEK